MSEQRPDPSGYWQREGDTWTLHAEGQDFDGLTLSDQEAGQWVWLYGAGPYRDDEAAKERFRPMFVAWADQVLAHNRGHG